MVTDRKLVTLIHYIGQTELRAGLTALAAILWKVDSEAYLRHGKPVTSAVYIASAMPGAPVARGGVLKAFWDGIRWGNVDYHLRTGRLTAREAVWVADRWADGVPL